MREGEGEVGVGVGGTKVMTSFNVIVMRGLSEGVGAPQCT